MSDPVADLLITITCPFCGRVIDVERVVRPDQVETWEPVPSEEESPVNTTLTPHGLVWVAPHPRGGVAIKLERAGVQLALTLTLTQAAAVRDALNSAIERCLPDPRRT